MPLTCNAVGDVLALIQLAIDIARFVADYRHAPSECRALLQDLRSMERLLALAQPTILAIKDAALKEATAERLRIVSQRVQDALNLVVKFRSAFDNAPVDPRSKWRATIVKWVTKQSEKVAWALKRNGDAEACRVAIAQSFEPLTLALLLAWNGDQAGVLSLLRQSQDDLSHEIQHMRTGQGTLHQEVTLLTASHDRLQASLVSMQDQWQLVISAMSRDVQATHINTIHLRRDLGRLHAVAASSQAVSALNINMQDHFIQVHDELSDMKRVQREQAEVLARLMANPLVLIWARLRSSSDQFKITTRAASESGGSITPRSSLESTTTGPVIVAALLLAGRAANPTEQMAWAGFAFTLFIAQNLTRMYKAPLVIHVIFIKGFCDDEYEVPFIEVNSAVKLHRALTRRLIGKVGDCLLKERMYEIHKRAGVATPTRLPTAWTRQLLCPGDKIELAALVDRFINAETTSQAVICLSCSAVIPMLVGAKATEQLNEPWATCPRCPATVQVSSEDKSFSSRDSWGDDNEAVDVEDNDRNTETSGSEAMASSNTPALSIQDTLSLCRRVHFIERFMDMHVRTGGETDEVLRGQKNRQAAGGPGPQVSQPPQPQLQPLQPSQLPQVMTPQLQQQNAEQDDAPGMGDHVSGSPEGAAPSSSLITNQHIQVFLNQSPPPTDRAEFVDPFSPSVATIHSYAPPPGNATSPTAHVIGPPSTNSSTCLAPSSLILPRVTNPEITGGDQVTVAFILHNFILHRGYSPDWVDESVPRSRAWKSTVLVDGHPFGIGIGPRKMEARQAAAAHALAYFRSHPTALPSRRRMDSTA